MFTLEDEEYVVVVAVAGKPPPNTLALPVALAGKSLNNSRNVLVNEESLDPCCWCFVWGPELVRTNFTKL